MIVAATSLVRLRTDTFDLIVRRQDRGLSITLDLLVGHHAEDMLHAIPCQHSLLPTREFGVFRWLPGILRIAQNERNLSVPHDEGQVRVGTLVAHKPRTVLEMGVENSSDAFDFIVVAFASGRESLVMKEVEPGCGAVVG